MKFIKIIVIPIIIFGLGVFLGKYLYQRNTFQAPAPNYLDALKNASDSASVGVASVAIIGNTIEVKPGNSIQEAVTKSKPGDLIRVFPGVYNETVFIDKDNISIQGIIKEGQWPILDGQKTMNDALLYSGNGILIENIKIINYKGNGIMGQAGNNFVIRNNWIVDTGVYGIFPQFGKNGVVERNILSGIEDAAIYVGMCDNVDVRFNEVYDNVAGIEIENCRFALVEYNYAHDNTGGILVFLTPGLPIKTCSNVIVRNNYVLNNNTKNFGAVGSLVSHIPKGTGLLVMAADDVTIENNFVIGNNNAGITITDYDFAGIDVSSDPDSEPNSDRIVVLNNVMNDNGNDPNSEVKTLMATKFSQKGPDVVAVGGGVGSCISNPDQYRTYGVNKFALCAVSSTSSITTYMLPTLVAPRSTNVVTKGKITYFGVCSGCHSYSTRLVGPPVNTIQAIYKDNPEGIMNYIINPERKREDYPAMPPQNYLSEETRRAVAEYMLSIKK